MKSGKKKRGLKILRVCVAVVYFLLITSLFTDIKDWLPVSVGSWIVSLQLVPAVLRAFASPSMLIGSLLFVLLLTILVGRFYCSTFCPFGILQDILLFFKRIFQKRKKYSSLPSMRYLRYIVLAIFVLSLISGSLVAVILLDPYSIFGRFATGGLRQATVYLNNGLVGVLEKTGSYAVYPFDLKFRGQFLVYFGIAVTGLVMFWTWFKGRIYCNSICPVGVFLGLLSRVSFFKIKIDAESCNSCGLCERSCKAGCISSKDKQVDWSRCVVCFNCLDSCPKGGLSLGKMKLQPVVSSSDERRQFIRQGLLFATGTTMLPASGIVRATNSCQSPVMPPGAGSADRFNSICTSCQLCVTNCPSGVLQPSFLEYGFLGMMQPHMNFQLAFCTYDCKICSDICPTGSIQPMSIDEKKLVRIGKAKFDEDKCVVHTDEKDCIACGEHCPTKAVEMVSYKGNLVIPKINDDLCIGCGACEFACPVTPEKAITVTALAAHETAKKPVVKKQVIEKPMEEFPF